MKLPCVEALEMVQVGEKYAKKKEADRQSTPGPNRTADYSFQWSVPNNQFRDLTPT